MAKILKNKGFYKDGKKYHKNILKKVLTLVKNGGKLMSSSRGLTSELNIKTIWFFNANFIWKINKKIFLKKLKKSVDKQKNILYNTNRSPRGRTKSTLKSKQ